MATSPAAHAQAVASTTGRGSRRPTASNTLATMIGTAMAIGGTSATPSSKVTTDSALQGYELVWIHRAVSLVHLHRDRQQQGCDRRGHDEVGQCQCLHQRIRDAGARLH